jgi:hypothetical protein
MTIHPWIVMFHVYLGSLVWNTYLGYGQTHPRPGGHLHELRVEISARGLASWGTRLVSHPPSTDLVRVT